MVAHVSTPPQEMCIHSTSISKAVSKVTIFKPEESIAQEFSDIRAWTREYLTTQSYEEAKKTCNITKSRYHDVLPFDSNRVRLQAKPFASDFINASNVNFGSPLDVPAYIACQAPLPSTFSDFWRMIWEQNTKVVVMLTNFIEKNVQKAHQYWPEEGLQHQYGNIIVTTLRTKTFHFLALRCIRLSLFNDEGVMIEKRDIIHLHYTEWSDMGIPQSTKGIRNLIKLINCCSKRTAIATEPIVVHCSAGIGRAGTFIAIDEAVRRLDAKASSKNMERYVDVKNIVQTLRSKRIGMVQTLSQYQYIYKSIQEHMLTSGLYAATL